MKHCARCDCAVSDRDCSVLCEGCSDDTEDLASGDAVGLAVLLSLMLIVGLVIGGAAGFCLGRFVGAG